ncbi:LexA family protein [Pokkaliibacter sp. CJK22405]|uniref:LexA family protein n=1 Tax=Pokkaliibacter sp. CJK22405 TaxID=3384615 RepID=UPI00398481F6
MQQSLLPTLEPALTGRKNTRPRVRSSRLLPDAAWIKPDQLTLAVFSSEGVEDDGSLPEVPCSDLLCRDRHDFLYEAFDRVLPSGIQFADTLIINGRLQPQSGDVVLVRLEEDTLLRQYHYANGEIILTTGVEDSAEHAIKLDRDTVFHVLGVVTRIIRSLR